MRGAALLLAATAACSGALPALQGLAGPDPSRVATAVYAGNER